MGIFKSFGEFATGAVQGARAALPGIQAANAQRQAQERQMRFQRELEGNRLDFTREQSILNRIDNIANTAQGEAMLESPLVRGRPDLMAAVQTQIEGLAATREQHLADIEAATTRERELATFTADERIRSGRAVAKTQDEIADANEAERSEREMLRALIGQTLTASGSPDANIDAAIRIANEGGLKRYAEGLKQMKALGIRPKAWQQSGVNTSNVLDAMEAAQLLAAEKWNDMSGEDRWSAVAEVLNRVGLPVIGAQAQTSAVNSFVATMTAQAQGGPRPLSYLHSEWTRMAIGRPGFSPIARDAAIQQLREKNLVAADDPTPLPDTPYTQYGRQAREVVGNVASAAYSAVDAVTDYWPPQVALGKLQVRAAGEYGPAVGTAASQFLGGALERPAGGSQ